MMVFKFVLPGRFVSNRMSPFDVLTYHIRVVTDIIPPQLSLLDLWDPHARDLYPNTQAKLLGWFAQLYPNNVALSFLNITNDEPTS